MNASLKALALSAAFTVCLTACHEDKLVNPSQPQAKPTDATALSGARSAANERRQYRLVKIDYQLVNGSVIETNCFYDRANQLVEVAGPGQVTNYSYGSNNTVSALKQTKLQNQPFKKQSLWTYYLSPSGRVFKANRKYFDQNEILIPGPGTDYSYLYNGHSQLVRTSKDSNPANRDTLIYNGNGDLVKELSFNDSGDPSFEQQHYYDKPGPYATNLQPTGPRLNDPFSQGLLPDYGPLNPWNLTHVDEYLPIFGQFRKHLPKRYIQISSPGQAPNADWSYGYVLNTDGYATERKTKTIMGSQTKHTYNFVETEVGPVK